MYMYIYIYIYINIHIYTHTASGLHASVSTDAGHAVSASLCGRRVGIGTREES